MKRVLLTGMSGVGKSSVIAALRARGFKAVDTDYGGFSALVSGPADEPAGPEPGQDWVWREDRIQDLLDTEDAEVLFVSGTSPNQGKFYPRFDHVILLSAPTEVVLERLATRTTNPYGKRPEEIAKVLDEIRTVEPLLRRGAGHEIDTSIPLDRVVERVLGIAGVSG